MIEWLTAPVTLPNWLWSVVVALLGLTATAWYREWCLRIMWEKTTTNAIGALSRAIETATLDVSGGWRRRARPEVGPYR